MNSEHSCCYKHPNLKTLIFTNNLCIKYLWRRVQLHSLLVCIHSFGIILQCFQGSPFASVAFNCGQMEWNKVMIFTPSKPEKHGFHKMSLNSNLLKVGSSLMQSSQSCLKMNTHTHTSSNTLKSQVTISLTIQPSQVWVGIQNKL